MQAILQHTTRLRLVLAACVVCVLLIFAGPYASSAMAHCGHWYKCSTGMCYDLCNMN